MGRRKLERRSSAQDVADQVVHSMTGKSTRCDLCKRVIRGEIHWKSHGGGRKVPLCHDAPDCFEGRR